MRHIYLRILCVAGILAAGSCQVKENELIVQEEKVLLSLSGAESLLPAGKGSGVAGGPEGNADPG